MLSSRNVLMLTGLGALLAVVALFAGVMAQTGGDRRLPVAEAAPASPTSTSAATATSTSTSASNSTDTDALGFIGSKARCEAGQSAVAVGRTQRSVVVICADPGGDYEYRGVRVNDGAALTVSAESSGDGVFVARNDGALYTVSPTDLTVTSGGKVIYRDTWAFYEASSLAAESGGAASTSASTSTKPSAAKPR